jgi:hypothetical protein
MHLGAAVAELMRVGGRNLVMDLADATTLDGLGAAAIPRAAARPVNLTVGTSAVINMPVHTAAGVDRLLTSSAVSVARDGR